MRTIWGTMLAVSLVIGTACGDDDDVSDTVVSDTVSDTVAGTNPPGSDPAGDGPRSIDEIDIPADGEAAGSLFGGASATQTAADEATVDPATPGEPCQDPPCESDVVEPVEPVDPFVPLPEHQAFCSLLAEMEQRPLPDDEIDQIIVIQAWFRELRVVTPDEIAAPFDVVIAFVDDIVSTQSFDLEPAEDDPVLPAIDAIGEFVGESC